MNIQLLSDLHLEVHPHWTPQPAPDAHLLVLAGDIGSYQAGSKLLDMADPDFGLARFSPLNGWPTPVLFVPGNHEYDSFDFDLAHARLQETCKRLGLVWLERATHELPPETVPGQTQAVRFVGTTLWADFDALCPAPVPGTNPLTAQLKAREKAFRAANFYLKKALVTRSGTPMLAAEVRAQAVLCQNWLRATLLQPYAGATVVVTHFAPSLLSADPRYGRVPGSAGFCNALDDLFPLARLWLHGHLHAPSDYVSRGCRVVANPLGYARKNEQAAFDPLLCVTL